MPPSLRSTATLEEALRAHESGELFDGPGRVAEAVEEDQEGTDLEEDEGEEPASAVDPDEAGEAGQEETVEVAPVWTEADKAEVDSELQAEEVEPPRQPSKTPALCRFWRCDWCSAPPRRSTSKRRRRPRRRRRSPSHL